MVNSNLPHQRHAMNVLARRVRMFSKSLSRGDITILALCVLIFIGLFMLIMDCWWTSNINSLFAAGLFALTCLIVGCLAGFLFAIPTVLQGDHSGAVAGAPIKTSYSQRVNTSLEEISDWLTKIIVGLSIYNLAHIPSWVIDLANRFATVFNHCPPQQGVLSAAIIFFTVSGFLLGYLVTRLYLQVAMGTADKLAADPVPDVIAENKDKATQPDNQNGNNIKNAQENES